MLIQPYAISPFTADQFGTYRVEKLTELTVDEFCDELSELEEEELLLDSSPDIHLAEVELKSHEGEVVRARVAIDGDCLALFSQAAQLGAYGPGVLVPGGLQRAITNSVRFRVAALRLLDQGGS